MHGAHDCRVLLRCLFVLVFKYARVRGAPSVQTRRADIWLVVSVPVLSEQMTVVQPSVSTDGSFLHGSKLHETGNQNICFAFSP